MPKGVLNISVQNAENFVCCSLVEQNRGLGIAFKVVCKAVFVTNCCFCCSAFNNVFSNIGYVMLGFLFFLLVMRR